MDKLDDTLQHYGVKGMKWGVRRSKEQLSKARKKVGDHFRARARKKNERLKKIADKYHEKNKGKRTYKKHYQRNLQKFEKRGYKSAHHEAVLQTRREVRAAKRAIVYSVTSIAAPAVASLAVGGMKTAGKLYRNTVTPENIRRGKNVIQAMKNSPIRYVDSKMMKNIIN